MTNRIAMFPRATWLPLLVAILCLAGTSVFLLGGAHQKAHSIGSLSRLKAIGLEMHIYAEAHDGKLPPLKSRETLIAALKKVPIDEAESLAWRLPFATNPRYSGTDFEAIPEPAEIVLVFEPKALWSEGKFRNVLFADGHAKTVDDRRWREIRAKSGIPMSPEPSVARWWETGKSGPKEPLPRGLFGNTLAFVTLFWVAVAAWLRARLCPQPVTAFFCALIIYAVFLPLVMLLIAVLISVTGSILGMIFSRFG